MITTLPTEQQIQTVRRANRSPRNTSAMGTTSESGTSRSVSVGRRAIRESLSTNAQTFLRDIRQESGE